MLRLRRQHFVILKMPQPRIVFGTIVRNIEKTAFQLIDFLNTVHKLFPDARTFVYENNSTDSTRTFFPLLQSIGPNIVVKSETITKEAQLDACRARTWDNLPCRMEVIAAARNKLLEMIDAAGYADDDLIVLFDGDMLGVEVGVLADRLRAFPSDVDVLFANGLNRNGETYYDTYALRSPAYPFGPELRGLDFWNNLPRVVVREKMQVYSAFGGLAIYKGYCVRNNRYAAVPTRALDTHLRTLGWKQPDDVETHYKGGLIGAYLFGTDGLFYVNNSGYNFPVVCEHSTFHAEMLSRGHTRLYIDPELKYYSTH